MPMLSFDLGKGITNCLGRFSRFAQELSDYWFDFKSINLMSACANENKISNSSEIISHLNEIIAVNVKNFGSDGEDREIYGIYTNFPEHKFEIPNNMDYPPAADYFTYLEVTEKNVIDAWRSDTPKLPSFVDRDIVLELSQLAFKYWNEPWFNEMCKLTVWYRIIGFPEKRIKPEFPVQLPFIKETKQVPEIKNYLDNEKSRGRIVEISPDKWPFHEFIAEEVFSVQKSNGVDYRFVTNNTTANRYIGLDKFTQPNVETLFRNEILYTKLVESKYLSTYDYKDFYRQWYNHPSCWDISCIKFGSSLLIDLSGKQGSRSSSFVAQQLAETMDRIFNFGMSENSELLKPDLSSTFSEHGDINPTINETCATELFTTCLEMNETVFDDDLPKTSASYSICLQDDRLILNADEKSAEKCEFLNYCFGFELKNSKSQELQTCVEWSGYKLDTVSKSVSLTDKRIKKLNKYASQILKKEFSTKRTYCKFLGCVYSARLQIFGNSLSMSPMLYHTRMSTQLFENFWDDSELKSSIYDEKIKKPSDLKIINEIYFAIDVCKTKVPFSKVREGTINSKFIINKVPRCITKQDLVIVSDSAKDHFGGYIILDGKILAFSQPFSKEISVRWSINTKEFFASFATQLSAFIATINLATKNFKKIYVFIDNQCAKSIYASGKVSLKSADLAEVSLLYQMFRSYLNRVDDVAWSPEFYYIDTISNEKSDRLSRDKSLSSIPGIVTPELFDL